MPVQLIRANVDKRIAAPAQEHVPACRQLGGASAGSENELLVMARPLLINQHHARQWRRHLASVEQLDPLLSAAGAA